MEWHGWDLTYMITTSDYGHMKAKWLSNGKHGQGTHYTKMGADSLAENTRNAHNLSTQFVCSSPKVLDFNDKRLHRASVVRGEDY